MVLILFVLVYRHYFDDIGKNAIWKNTYINLKGFNFYKMVILYENIEMKVQLQIAMYIKYFMFDGMRKHICLH